MPQSTGLFGGIPFDMRTEEELLLEKRANRFQQARDTVDSIGYQHPSEQIAARIGATLGAVITNKFSPPSLTEQEQARTSAVANATERFKAYRSEHKDAPAEDLGLVKQRFLVEELLQAGDPQALDMATAYAEQARAKRRGEIEISRLETSEQIDAARLRQANFDVENNEFLWKRGALKTVWDPSDPEDIYGRDAFIREEDGAAVFADGRVLPLGEYTSHPSSRANGRHLTLNERGIGTIEQRDARNHMNFVASGMRASLEMKDALEEAVAATGQVNILGASGAASSWIGRTIDALSGVGSTIELMYKDRGQPLPPVRQDGRDLSNAGSAMSYVDQSPGFIASLRDLMPPSIRGQNRAEARWTAAMVQLAYAKGMSAESGARNLSDADFQNHVRGIAGATSDPETFRQVMLGNMNRDIEALEDRVLTYAPDVREQLFSPARLEKWAQQKAEFMEAFGDDNDFGSPGQPGPGLTRPPANESDDDFLNRILGGSSAPTSTAPAAGDDGFSVEFLEQ